MIRNYQKNGGIDINLTPIYQSISGLKNNIEDLESLTTLTDLSVDIAALQQSCSNLNDSLNSLSQSIVSNSANIDLLKTSMFSLDYVMSNITNSLSTLNGVYTANSFNNQAFNTTLNLNSDMFFTGQFGLNSGAITCNDGIWDLKELKKTFCGSITAKSLSNLKMDNFNLSYCDFSFTNKCLFDDCNLTQCAITGNFINLDNCSLRECLFDDRTIEFKNMTFSNTISFYNGGILSFCNVNFKPSDCIMSVYSGNYRIYIVNCLYNGTTSNADAFKNMFQNGGGAYRDFALF